jgi:hypothetical protein
MLPRNLLGPLMSLRGLKPVGLSTSRLRVIMKYGKENANTHLTLQALADLAFAERDDSTRRAHLPSRAQAAGGLSAGPPKTKPRT